MKVSTLMLLTAYESLKRTGVFFLNDEFTSLEQDNHTYLYLVKQCHSLMSALNINCGYLHSNYPPIS